MMYSRLSTTFFIQFLFISLQASFEDGSLFGLQRQVLAKVPWPSGLDKQTTYLPFTIFFYEGYFIVQGIRHNKKAVLILGKQKQRQRDDNYDSRNIIDFIKGIYMLPQQDQTAKMIERHLKQVDQNLSKAQCSSALLQILKKLQAHRLYYAVLLYSQKLLQNINKIEAKTDSQVFNTKAKILAICFAQMPQQIKKTIQPSVIKSDVFQQTEIKIIKEEPPQEKIFRKFVGLLWGLQQEKKKQSLLKAIRLSANISVKVKSGSKVFLEGRFAEYAVNYLKKQVQSMRMAFPQIKSNLLCCQAAFRKNEPVQAFQNETQEFKKYMWPIKNTNIEKQLLKNIIGFLNSKGGIIYIGIYQNKEKRVEVQGIELTDSNMNEFHDFIGQKVQQHIYPRKDDMLNKYKKQRKYEDYKGRGVNTEFERYIDKYIKIEFIPLRAEHSLLNEYTWQEDGAVKATLFLMKIIVKQGHPKHFYHYIPATDRKLPEFYERVDHEVKSIKPPEAYKEIYRRLGYYQQMQQKNQSIKKQPFHKDCQYCSSSFKVLDSDSQPEQP